MAILHINRESGIPLMGSLSFGIVDKGSQMLEIKPNTGCNINCIFCSVDEGSCSKKTMDIVIEKNYLVEEIRKILEFKKHTMDIFINPHGEPLLYEDVVELVADLRKFGYVRDIVIITNGTLLSEKVDRLIEAGLTGLNISLNTLHEKKAVELAEAPYNVDRIKEIIDKVKDKVKITLAPVLMKNINENDIEELVKYCKEHNLEIGIQNFLKNSRGRNPTKQISMKKFYKVLEDLEEKHQIKLIKEEKIEKTKTLPKPFRRGQVIDALLVCRGRYDDESYAIAQNRIITIKKKFTHRKPVKIKLIRDSFNIYNGKEIKK